MAYDHATIIRYQAEQLEAERAAASRDYEASRLAEDGDGTLRAADRYVEVETRLAALNRIAGDFAAREYRAQQQHQHNPHRLTQDELDIAKVSGITDAQYAANKQRMHEMKAAGYWSQGRVFKT